MIFSLTYFIRILSDFDIKATNIQIAFVIHKNEKFKKFEYQKHTRTEITLIDSSILVQVTYKYI